MVNLQDLKYGQQKTTENRKIQEHAWREFIEEQKKSGMSQTAFCKQYSIPPHRFTYWKQKFLSQAKNHKQKTKQSKNTPKRSSLIPVKLVPDKHLYDAPTHNCFEVVLSNNRVVRIPHHFDAHALRQLLSVVEEPC